MSELKVTNKGNAVVKILIDVPTLQSAKDAATAKVNPEARRRIEALDWMLDRANRHSKLNKSQKKSELEVLQLQQDIEEASDAAIIAINALPAETTIEEVQAFTW